MARRCRCRCRWDVAQKLLLFIACFSPSAAGAIRGKALPLSLQVGFNTPRCCPVSVPAPLRCSSPPVPMELLVQLQASLATAGQPAQHSAAQHNSVQSMHQ